MHLISSIFPLDKNIGSACKISLMSLLDKSKTYVKNSLELIGSTPLVKLDRITPQNGAKIFGKLESCNPGGSVKDRIALAMVEDAENKGILKNENLLTI